VGRRNKLRFRHESTGSGRHGVSLRYSKQVTQTELLGNMLASDEAYEQLERVLSTVQELSDLRSSLDYALQLASQHTKDENDCCAECEADDSEPHEDYCMLVDLPALQRLATRMRSWPTVEFDN